MQIERLAFGVLKASSLLLIPHLASPAQRGNMQVLLAHRFVTIVLVENIPLRDPQFAMHVPEDSIRLKELPIAIHAHMDIILFLMPPLSVSHAPMENMPLLCNQLRVPYVNAEHTHLVQPPLFAAPALVGNILIIHSES
jgi:hypothetical protein